MMEIPILFEDDALFIINKPAGVVVNRAESVKTETIQDWIIQRTQSLKLKTQNEGAVVEGGEERKVKMVDDRDVYAEFYSRNGFVHRIDKETSGILLIAKTPESFEILQTQFRERNVHKTYLALVHGDVLPDAGEIRAPVGRLPWNKERFGIVPGGKDAVTKYKKIAHYELPTPVAGQAITKEGKEKISLVELQPETGRTHQIRVHLKYINHPILGDFLYAGRKTSRDDRITIPRIMLHAWKITFEHPISHEMLSIEAPIPEDMNDIIKSS